MIAQMLDSIVGVLWGPTLLIGLVGTGLYFTVITGFWQLRNLKRAFCFCFLKKNGDEKQSKTTVSPYQAAAVAIGGSIGSGNIGGVAGAIALGGVSSHK